MKKRTDDWMWMQSSVDKDKWSTTLIPSGDIHAPRISRMSKNSDGSYTFAVYRNQKFIGCTRGTSEAGLEDAKQLAREGKMREDTLKKGDRVRKYLDDAGNRPGSADAFKRFTKAEQQLIAETYPWAMPRKSELEAKGVKVQTTRTDLQTKGEKKAAELALPMDSKIVRLKDGNPKKVGSAPYPRWVLLFSCADASKTVGEFVKEGGNTTTLKNAVIQGWVKVKGYEPT
jgi:hypothetical protein